MIGVILALPQEMGPIRAKVKPLGTLQEEAAAFYPAFLEGQPLVLARCGIGKERAKKATERLLKLFKVEAVVSAGFAGGLVEGITAGELIVVRNVLYCHQGEGPIETFSSYSCHPGLLNLSLRIAQEQGLRAHCGDLVAMDEVVTHPVSKKRLGETTSALAVDMESLGVAETARDYAVPFLAIKVVTDEVGQELKAQGLVNGEGRVRPLKLIYYLLSNPQDIIHLMNLRRQTKVASENLALFLSPFVKRYGEALNSRAYGENR